MNNIIYGYSNNHFTLDVLLILFLFLYLANLDFLLVFEKTI